MARIVPHFGKSFDNSINRVTLRSEVYPQMLGIGVKKHLKGSITPKLSDKMLPELHRQWELQFGTKAVPHPTLKKMDGETFGIEYDDTWDENSLKHTFRFLVVGKAVNLMDPKSTPPDVTYNS
jgi:hypothetical protein